MAQTWPAKAPTEIVERRWTVPVDAGDGLASFARVPTGVTIDAYEVQGNDAVLTLSAGTAGDTASVVLTATTNRGKALVETFYLPVQVSANAFAYTARDACGFALRKVVGNGVEADAAELADALERLNDMLASWKEQGADAGVPLPLTADDGLPCSDAFAQAIKYNLKLRVHDHYDAPLTAFDVDYARRGLQQIKSANLSTGPRETVFY